MGGRERREGAAVNGPSQSAETAALDAFVPSKQQDCGAVRRALAAAHDPALGLDASVRVGDVLDALRRGFRIDHGQSVYEAAAAHVEREFGNRP
jgi:hypothetical protein